MMHAFEKSLKAAERASGANCQPPCDCRRTFVLFSLCLAGLGLLAPSPLHCGQPGEVISLAGTWRFRLDGESVGHQMNWQTHRYEGDIFLPGSTDQAGYGFKTYGPARGWLSRPYVYSGPAWYQRDVVIPAQWRGKRITLFLERPHWQTEVWAGGKAFGVRNSLSVPHVYDLTEALTPGTHTISICVDNSYKIDVGRHAHSVADHTQTNWNGVVGRIELRAGDPVWIDSVQLYPDLARKSARVDVTVGNVTGRPVEGTVAASIPGVLRQPVSAKSAFPDKEQRVSLSVPMEGAQAWGEYEPQLYDLQVSLSAGGAGQEYHDTWTVVTGFRDLTTRGGQFVLNGRPFFLRGTLECNIFPLTGYPPMTTEGWERLFRIARSYGLNHFRFHSWCPPRAAFEAADRAGFLLHVELPVWNRTVGSDAAVVEFMRAEGRRIQQEYGNHPSFTMMCLGNELKGDYSLMDQMVAELKAADGRRLYTFSADFERLVPGESSDYYVAQRSKGGYFRIHQTRFGKSAGGTDFDFSGLLTGIATPVVAHELGQWVTYPSYEEIAKYSGVLKARNLEAFRAVLEQRGMSDQARDFQHASGRFAWLVYKEDIETALRTPHFGGVQLLQLQDFPGQGEALIGLLDSFWDSKGLFTSEEVRGFFDRTVALLRFPKFVWTNDETFRGTAQVAHYGPAPLSGAVIEWMACDDSGRTVAQGRLSPANIALGEVATLGEVSFPLAKMEHAARLTISLQLVGTSIRNQWDIWVYPKTPPASSGDVLVTNNWDDATRQKLAAGGKALLLWPKDRAGKSTMPMRFLPVFWSLSWFPKQPGTMGVLCDPAHPALAAFPTDMHSNWQWWELTEAAPVFILDDTAPEFRPIVHVIDDYHRNHKLGVVFEARYGKGRLLVSSLDLESNLEQRPVARQLRHSLLAYMQSPRFAPQHEPGAAVLDRLLASQDEKK